MDTGGRRLTFSTVKNLEDALQAIGKEVHAQYFLTFAPSNRDPGYHPLEVQVTAARNLQVRARSGFWLDSRTGNPAGR